MLKILSKLLLLSALMISLSACIPHDAVTIDTSPSAVKLSIVIPPRPRPVQNLPVQVVVITKDNTDSLFVQLKKDPTTTWLTLTPDYYQNLILNVGDMRRFIQEQNALILYYENTIQSIEKSSLPK